MDSNPGTAGKLFALAALAVALCSPAPRAALAQGVPTPRRTPEPGTHSKWVGMTRAELFKKLGKPSQIVEYPDTGGQLLVYHLPDGRHYVFETGANGRVARAAQLR